MIAPQHRPAAAALAAAASADRDTADLGRLLEACATAGVRRQALLLRVGTLPAALTRPQHLRIMQAALDPLLGADRARLFRLRDETLIAIWRGEARGALHRALLSLEHLLADLPRGGADGSPPEIISLLELPRDNAVLAEAIAATVVSEAAPPPGPSTPLDPAALVGLETALQHADVAFFSRRKAICHYSAAGAPVLAWEKRYLAVKEVAASLAPGFVPQSDPWLFRRLTRSFDRRMLALLTDPEELLHGNPFAFNINVASILSPEFLRFDGALTGALRGSVVLDLLPADILSDLNAFAFARDFARSRGYRLLLRGLTVDLLGVFPAGLLELDMLQLRYSDGMPRLPADVDPARLVLARTDSEAALEWGQAHGISLFQGAHIQAPRRRLARLAELAAA